MCGVVWGWGYVAVSDKHAWHFIIPSLSHTHSLSLTPHLFAFLIFSSSSFLFLLNILSLSTFLLSFLLLLQSPLSSSHFPPPSFSFRFLQPLKPSNSAHLIGSVPPIHSDSFTFFKLFFFWISRFRISQLEVVFFFFYCFFVTTKSIGAVSLLLLSPGTKLLQSVFVTLVFSDSFLCLIFIVFYSVRISICFWLVWSAIGLEFPESISWIGFCVFLSFLFFGCRKICMPACCLPPCVFICLIIIIIIFQIHRYWC